MPTTKAPPRRNASRPAEGWAGESAAERAANGRPAVRLSLPAEAWALAPQIAEALELPGGAERGRSLAVAAALVLLAGELEGASQARRAELRALAEPFFAPNAPKASPSKVAARPKTLPKSKR
ncbi:MAG TPA: hypothetical protein VFS43_13270 [Polyangiaceae bacterium]|nr:hypothetical protein [Polyangiaceae bacterium]